MPVHAAPAFKEYSISCALPPDRQGKPQPPIVVRALLPKDCDGVRGVIVAHPMIGGFAAAEPVLNVCADEKLGTMVFPAFSGDVTETVARLDAVLADWAGKSGHPELKGAAVFTAGLSASVLASRHVAVHIPDRTFGTLHVAGGNFRHGVTADFKALVGVPLIAMNGEFESCGPDGPFLRPHLGRDDQYYSIREEMLDRRKACSDNLLSLLIVPGADHGAWDVELAALFLRKAAHYRLPKARRDGSTPAQCVRLKAEDGWLADGDLKHPRHPPAPYAEYKGDRDRAFWHFDREMAEAMCRYHHGRFRPPGTFDALWPLGQRMDIPFHGRGAPAYAEAIRGWMTTKLGETLHPTILRFLAASIADKLQLDAKGEDVDEAGCRKAVQRACYNYDDSFAAMEKAVLAAGLPPAFKELMLRHYALLELWPLRPDPAEVAHRTEAARLAGIPASSRFVTVARGTSLQDAIQAAFPEFAELGPASRWLLVEELAAINPCLRREGSFRTEGGLPEAGAPADGRPDLISVQILERLYAVDPGLRPEGAGDPPPLQTVRLPLGNGSERVFRYRIAPPGLLAIPPADRLRAWANPRRLNLRNAWIASLEVLRGLTPVELDLAGCDASDLAPLSALPALRRLRIANLPVSDLAPIRGLKLVALDVTGTLVADLDPLRGMPLEELNLAGTAVRDLTPLQGMPLRSLDLDGSSVTNLAPLAGLPLTWLRLSLDLPYERLEALRRHPTLTRIGDVPLTAWLNEYEEARRPPAGPASLLPLPARADKAAALPAGASWPQPRGPSGTGAALQSGEEAVVSASDVRAGWRCAQRLPATQTDGQRRPAPRLRTAVAGGQSSPALADGRLFLAWYKPAGSVYPSDLVRRHVEGGGMGREKWLTDADQTVACVEADTGRTVWHRTFAESGYNYNAESHRGGVSMTPCVAGGRVFSLGTDGRLYAVSAADGRPLWTADLGFRSLHMQHVAQWSRETSNLWSAVGDWTGNPQAADGVVAVSDHREQWNVIRFFGGSLLLGFDAATGARLWEAPGVTGNATPLLWRHKGKEFFITWTDGRIFCLEPRTGKVLWNVQADTAGPIAAAEDSLFCNAGGETRGFACFAIGPDKASSRWIADGAPAPAAAGAVVWKDHVYIGESWKETVEGEERTFAGLRCLNAQSGKTVARVNCGLPGQPPMVADGRLIVIGTDLASLVLVNAEPRAFLALGRPLPLPLAAGTQPAAAAGRLFVRTRDRLVSFDLRRAACFVQADESHALLAAVRGDPAPRRDEAALALGNVAPDLIADTVDALAGLLKLKEEGRIVLAGETLVGLALRSGAPPVKRAAVSALLPLLKGGGSSSLKQAAAGFLGQFGPDAKGAVPDLEAAYLQEPLRDAARAALQQILQTDKIVVNPKMAEPRAEDAATGLDL